MSKQRRLLKRAIMEWIPLASGSFSEDDTPDCPLCDAYMLMDLGGCPRCPISIDTGREYCAGTPFGDYCDEVADAMEQLDVEDTSRRVLNSYLVVTSAKKELAYLIDLDRKLAMLEKKRQKINKRRIMWAGRV